MKFPILPAGNPKSDGLHFVAIGQNPDQRTYVRQVRHTHEKNVRRRKACPLCASPKEMPILCISIFQLYYLSFYPSPIPLLKKMKQLLLFALTLSLVSWGLEWNFQGTRSDWTGDRHLTATVTDKGLELELTDKYSNIAAPAVEFSPEGCEVMKIVYHATGLKENHGGQLYFGTKEDPQLDEAKKFWPGALIWDGEEHALLVDLKSAAAGQAYTIWQNASAITHLRLDLVNEANAKLLIKSISFIDRSEYVKTKFARQLALGVPLKMEVDLPNADRKNTAQKADAIFSSRMVSPDQTFEAIGLCNLRMKFNLDKAVKKSLWQSVCDDQVEALWINGQYFDRENWSTDWKVPDVFEIPADFFVPGDNLLAVAYRNTGSLGGLMMDLQLLMEDDEFLVLTPEDAVGMTGDAPKGWEQPGFDSSIWKKVSVRPGPPADPWVGFNPFYKSIQASGDAVNVNILSRHDLVADVHFSTQKGFQGNEKFFARLCLASGQILRNICGTAEELHGVKNEFGDLDFHFVGEEGECYGAPIDMFWEFGIIGRNAAGTTHVNFSTDDKPVPGDPIAVKLEQTPSGPVPMLDGKPFYFNILTVHSYSEGISLLSGMEGEGSPFNTIAIRLGGSGDTNWWYGPDQYDYNAVDRSINTLLARFPGCKLAIYVWCHPGNWYRKVYPDRLSLMEDGSQYNYYVAAVNFAHPEVRRDQEKAVADLVRHLEKYFGNRTILYNLMGGISCEWQGWAAHTDQYADYSAFGIRDFEAYAAKNGITTQGVPSRELREATMDGIFRSPEKDAVAILYDKYYSETIAECIDGIAKTIKETCGNTKLVGCYYGYLMEYANLGHCTNGGGHNDLQRLLDSPYMDFFLSPQSYGIRSFGAPNAEMKPYGAIRKAGKLSLLEDDTRTNLTQKTDFEQTLNLPLTLNILKRNVGMALSRNFPLNHLPLVGGNELDDPAIRKFFDRSIQVGQYLLENAKDPSPEIAAVIDADAIRYMGANRKSIEGLDDERFLYSHEGDLLDVRRYIKPIYGDLLYFQRIPLAQCGAPVDVILLPDVVKHAKDYKMVIFLNAFKDSPELRQAIRHLRDNNIPTVFTYGTGFLDNQGFNLDSLGECVGMKLSNAGEGTLRIRFNNGAMGGQTYLAATRFQVVDDDATPLARYADTNAVAVAQKDNAYFYGTTYLSQDFLRETARAAGVHIFCDTNDSFYASRDIISIHTAGGGHKTIRLPEKCDVVDIYSDEIVARQADSFDFDMTPFETRVFLYGDLEKIQQAVK